MVHVTVTPTPTLERRLSPLSFPAPPSNIPQTFRMWQALLLSVLLCLTGAVQALYKQWFPDTNFENGTNWDVGRVPCNNDRIHFQSQKKVSVYVGTLQPVLEMRLPMDGEFILASGAGFATSVGPAQISDCGPGEEVTFKDMETLQWLNPELWQAAETLEDLARWSFLFSVHEESVPCPYDDVVFRERSSFRVDTTGSLTRIPVRSLSVLGQKFDSDTELSGYLESRSGKLQFHGTSIVRAGEPACSDPSGCICDNSANRQRICSFVTCPPTPCPQPLHPVGHCCSICGAIVRIRCSSTFSIASYRQRVQHLFLGLPVYHTARAAISKATEEQRLLGVIPYTTATVQVLLLDEAEGVVAEALAQDIVKDARAQGGHLGIEGVEFKASSGNGEVAGATAEVAAGVAVGLLVLAGLALLLGFLLRRGIIKAPSLPSLRAWRGSEDIGDLGGPLDCGFDNPMFDKPSILPEVPGLCGTETHDSVILTPTGVHFVNPVYDETDFNA